MISIDDAVGMSCGIDIVAFARVTIDDGTMIGDSANLRDTNHRTGSGAPMRTSDDDAMPCVIERNAWIGRGVTILTGETIGDGGVAGADTVVGDDGHRDRMVVSVSAKALPEGRLE
jgi:acetyltransferase-like isoleucine patch superfamily enzyme